MATHLDKFGPLTLYMLKRQYGRRITIYKLLASETDARTGAKVVTTAPHVIDRAVILPTRYARVLTSAASTGRSDFVAGGSRDTRVKEFLVDRKDVAGLTTLTVDDWIMYDGRKCQVSTVEACEFDTAWLISTKEIAGDRAEQQIHVGVNQSVVIETEVSP